ncbi:hypothetical protein Rhe02_39870 [Rhizocola hellebori]|uniref:Uncharacterized protein n=1 Tax=Rhizocola hellebori TaxID=1392758 RepID=A0A8J3VGX1_9ACTN|nr:hypothetical protein [Rhizocola hellebori]GIH05920.1 hypothetical protein Rhe02_39870 [Rhizocola hellebori]
MTTFASDRVHDTVAHLSYRCPQGWLLGTDPLDSPFSTSITNGTGAIVVSGRWDDLPTDAPSGDELIAGAAWLASEYGEFFLPFDGNRTNVVIENANVAGRPAARAGYGLVFDPDARDPAYIRVLVVALTGDLVSFLLAVGPDAERHVFDGILASTQVLTP